MKQNSYEVRVYYELEPVELSKSFDIKAANESEALDKAERKMRKLLNKAGVTYQNLGGDVTGEVDEAGCSSKKKKMEEDADEEVDETIDHSDPSAEYGNVYGRPTSTTRFV